MTLAREISLPAAGYKNSVVQRASYDAAILSSNGQSGPAPAEEVHLRGAHAQPGQPVSSHGSDEQGVSCRGLPLEPWLGNGSLVRLASAGPGGSGSQEQQTAKNPDDLSQAGGVIRGGPYQRGLDPDAGLVAQPKRFGRSHDLGPRQTDPYSRASGRRR